jgi:hypothetical protein
VLLEFDSLLAVSLVSDAMDTSFHAYAAIMLTFGLYFIGLGMSQSLITFGKPIGAQISWPRMQLTL